MAPPKLPPVPAPPSPSPAVTERPALSFTDVSGGPVRRIKDPDNIPTNYRTVRFQLDGVSFQISGMASMDYHKNLPRSKLLGKVLPATNVRNYINLQHPNLPEKVQWELRGGTYTYIPMSGGKLGFNVGKVEEFERFYLNVMRAAKKGQNSVVHCGEGWGRTGTMLSSLKLRELVNKRLAEDPGFAASELAALKNNTWARGTIKMGKYNDTPTATGAAMVIDAINRVRAAPIRGEATKGGASVEITGQVESLTVYYFHMLKKAADKTGP